MIDIHIRIGQILIMQFQGGKYLAKYTMHKHQYSIFRKNANRYIAFERMH